MFFITIVLHLLCFSERLQCSVDINAIKIIALNINFDFCIKLLNQILVIYGFILVTAAFSSDQVDHVSKPLLLELEELQQEVRPEVGQLARIL